LWALKNSSLGVFKSNLLKYITCGSSQNSMFFLGVKVIVQWNISQNIGLNVDPIWLIRRFKKKLNTGRCQKILVEMPSETKQGLNMKKIYTSCKLICL
jgi:hypothetical protein